MSVEAPEETAPPRLARPATMPVPRARFGLRLLAFLLDFLLVFFLATMLLSQFILPRYFPQGLAEVNQAMQETLQTAGEEEFMDIAPARDLSEQARDTVNFINFFLILAFWVYFGLSEALMGGATLGKRVFSMRAVHSPELSRTSLLDALLRSGLKTLMLFVLPLLIANVAVSVFNRNRRALHDLLCRTVVVDDVAAAALARE